MWKIGNIEIHGKVVLAPMAGYTSIGYRKFMKKFGADVLYTEMVSDMGLIYENENTIAYLLTDESEKPIGVQLFGSEPENMKKAAQIVLKTTSKFDFFDINAGCPVPKVTRSGAGSSLLKNPDKLADLVKAIKEVTDKPVTVKIRLGWDSHSINFLDVIKKLEEAGVAMIAIHARTTKELYLGTPHFDMLKDLRSKMSVPLVVSGNIFTLDDAIKAIEITGADAVMIARGGVGNPTLIKQVNEYYKNNVKIPNATLEQQKAYCLELARMLIEEKGEERAMKVFRSMAPKFFVNYPNSKALRTDLAQNLVSYEYLENALKNF